MLPFVVDEAHRLPPADGFIPNSALVRLLFPEETSADQEESKYQPPVLTDSQIDFLNDFRQRVSCYSHSR